MTTILRCILLCALLAYAQGHSVLGTPVPLNTNPNKNAPCGAALPAKPVAAAQWVKGTTQAMTYHLVATDGGTSVTAAVDETGTAASFTTAIVAATPIGAKGNGLYALSVSVPKTIDCSKGPNGLCLVQVKSNTNWNSCIFVNLTDVAEPIPPPPPPACVVAPTLSFCSEASGAGVQIAAGNTPAGVDAIVSTSYTANLANTGVFTNGNDATCKAEFKTYLCAVNFPPCTASGATATATSACRSQCTAAMAQCQLTKDEAALYDCTSLPLCPGDAEGAASSVRGGAVVAVATLVALFAF